MLLASERVCGIKLTGVQLRSKMWELKSKQSDAEKWFDSDTQTFSIELKKREMLRATASMVLR